MKNPAAVKKFADDTILDFNRRRYLKYLFMKQAKNFTLNFYGTLFLVAFSLNWLWEVAQTFAFDISGVSGGKMLLFCTFASVIDGIVTVAVFWVLQKLIAGMNWKLYLSAAGSGALWAVFFEQMAFIFNLWLYDEEMPVLPFLGTGLLPFLQLTILVPTAIWLTKKLKKD